MQPEKFTIKSQETLNNCQKIVEKYSHQQIEPEHLLTALINDDGIAKTVFKKLGTDLNSILSALDNVLQKIPRISGGGIKQAYLSPRTEKILENALSEANKLNDEYISIEHIVLAIADAHDTQASKILSSHGVSKDTILKALTEIRGTQRVTDQNPEQKYQALQQYAKDLTEQARADKLDPVIGRDSEVRRVIQILSRRTKNNPVLIGEPGVGKTAIVEGLAQRIINGDVPESLKDKKLVSLDMGSLLAGAKLLARPALHSMILSANLHQRLTISVF